MTGDLSFGASALIEESGTPVGAVTGLSVAGNSFDVLRRAVGMEGGTHWSSAGSAFFGCPDLLVEGMVIGR